MLKQLVISVQNLQKVEFKADSEICNVSFTDYDATLPGRSLLVTDVPAGAGTMLGSVAVIAFGNPGVNLTTPPTVLVEYNDATFASNGAGANADSVKYGGRIEIREF